MRIYDLTDDQGRVFAFEIDNLWMDRASVASVVRTIPGARLGELHISWWGPDEFCEFDVAGTTFVALEPFGDNSRYWIGPRPLEFSEHTAIVRDAFAKHTPRSSNLLRAAIALVGVGSGVGAVGKSLGWSVLAIRAALGIVSLGLALGLIAVGLRLRGLRTPAP